MSTYKDDGVTIDRYPDGGSASGWTVGDVQALLCLVGPLGETCGAPHPYMRFGDGRDPNAERWACTLGKGHEGRCAMGMVLFPDPDVYREPAAFERAYALMTDEERAVYLAACKADAEAHRAWFLSGCACAERLPPPSYTARMPARVLALLEKP